MNEANYSSVVPNSTHCFGCHKSNLSNEHFCDLSRTPCGFSCKTASELKIQEQELEHYRIARDKIFQEGFKAGAEAVIGDIKKIMDDHDGEGSTYEDRARYGWRELYEYLAKHLGEKL